MTYNKQLNVRINVRDAGKGGSVQVYVDTRRKKRGPEFILSGPIARGGYDWRVTRVRRWRLQEKYDLLCPSSLGSSMRKDVVTASFAAGCLRNPDWFNIMSGDEVDRRRTKAPAKVRASVRTMAAPGSPWDWAPMRRKLFRPVGRA